MSRQNGETSEPCYAGRLKAIKQLSMTVEQPVSTDDVWGVTFDDVSSLLGYNWDRNKWTTFAVRSAEIDYKEVELNSELDKVDQEVLYSVFGVATRNSLTKSSMEAAPTEDPSV